MFAPFFVLAARSPSRQGAFRRAVAGHLAVLAVCAFALLHEGRVRGPVILGNVLLVAGIVQGAILVGWRLTQLPRSQALEFLLVSPLQPRRLFLGEAMVGLALLALITLSGLPLLVFYMLEGYLGPFDLIVLTLMPYTWGAVTGLGLTMWAYESKRVRRLGELVMVFALLFYLIVGILAGENLKLWITTLPETVQDAILWSFHEFHHGNPFGILRHWLLQDFRSAYERMFWGELVGCVLVGVGLWRCSSRLLAHFHERHYEPARDVSGEKRKPVGNRPLAWWAVKRVSEFAGRLNLYLAGGFCLLYGIYLLAEPHWPAYLGRRIFHLCDTGGGPAMLTVVLILLAAVPAAFQYGLWDNSKQDRCRRLELLLLTHLRPYDYWDAAARAAWVRGRGYLVIAAWLWLAAWWSGRIDTVALVMAVAAGVLLWGLYFALGFRAFARGMQANGLGMFLTLGVPLATIALGQLGWPVLSSCLPPGMVYSAGAEPPSWAWLLGALGAGATALWFARQSLNDCDARLRRWYDENSGNKVMT